jgi:hypothetical protein
MSYGTIDTIFQPIFDGSILTRSVLATLRKWYPTYLREIEFQRDYEQKLIPPPRTYTERWRFDTYPDEQVPIVVAVCPGMAGEASSTGDGALSGWWALGVGIIAAANSEENSERLAKIYGAGARAIIMQKSFLDDAWEYSGIDLMDETYTDVPDIEQSRTMRAAQVVFRVRVENIVNRLAGPAYPDGEDPDNQPGSEWPEVWSVFIDVNQNCGGR